MEAATQTDRDFALRLGALLMHVMSYGGAGAVVRALDGTGLSFVQMKTLITVGSDSDEETSVKHVAESLDVSLPSASRAVDGIVKKGLATRVEDPDDRRLRRISLTEEGHALVDQIVSSRLEGLERFVAELEPAERKTLDSALDVLLQREELAEIYRSHGRRVAK
jgi:DNA-binding MarR family transcriptional regulator